MQRADLLFEALLALMATDPPPNLADKAQAGGTEPVLTDLDTSAEAPSFLERLQGLVGLFHPAQQEQLPPEPISPAKRTPSDDGVERPSFQGVVEQYRAHGSQPALRDDDTTLVLCVPVTDANANLKRQALEIVHQHRKSAETVLPVIVKINA